MKAQCVAGAWIESHPNGFDSETWQEAIHTVDWSEGKLRELSLPNASIPLAVSGELSVSHKRWCRFCA
jgi:hypothetical protein